MEIEEMGVKLVCYNDHPAPTSDELFFNRKMSLAREFVLLTCCALYDEAYECGRNVSLECLDAFTATGAMSVLLKQFLQQDADIYCCDINEKSGESVKHLCHINSLDVDIINYSQLIMSGPLHQQAPSNKLKFIHDDALVVMAKRAFDFIHLDPFGSSVPYLDIAFRNIRHGGIISITSTDVACLFARSPSVVLRNYGAHIIKTKYAKELAVRVILAAIVISAAKSNKGIKCLFALVAEHFILINVQIMRGSKAADSCMSNLRPLLHCRLCEQQCYLPPVMLAPMENLCSYLPCNCHETSPGKTAIVLGRVWSEKIFDHSFLQRMQAVYKKRSMQSARLQKHLESLLKECVFYEKVETRSILGRKDAMSTHFYVNLNCLKLADCCIPSLQCVIDALNNLGYVTSPTHMDSRALRTTASRSILVEIILKLANRKNAGDANDGQSVLTKVIME